MNTIPYLIRLSQGHLNLLSTCPPKFQQVYLEQLTSPASPEQQEKQIWGSRFHLLMQQRELGLPMESLLAEDDELKRSFYALLAAVPELNQQTWREAEHCRTLSLGNYLLTVIYDLLIGEEQEAKILDWKTYLQPQNKTKLACNWQTRLYLYVLAETSEYEPEQISMTYWFVKLPHQPQSLTFTYSRSEHEQTKRDLNNLLTQLDHWLTDYLYKDVPFAHRSDCQSNCPYTRSFLPFGIEAKQQDLITSIASIEEVSL